MIFMENGQSRFNALRVMVFRRGFYPAFIGGTHCYPAVDKTAVIGLNTAGNYLPDNNRGGKNDKMVVRDYIAANNAAYGNISTGYIALYPGAFSDYYPAPRPYVSANTAVYAGKSPRFNIA
jgi:hypothetical protein